MYYTRVNYLVLLTLLIQVEFIFSRVNTDINRYNIASNESLIKASERSDRGYAIFGIDPHFLRGSILAFAYFMCNDLPEKLVKKKEVVCNINVRDLDRKHSLIIDPTDHTKFLYPDENGNIRLLQNQPIHLSCPHGVNTFNHTLNINKQHETFRCMCEETFQLENRLFNFKDLMCEDFPSHSFIDKGQLDVHNPDDGKIKLSYQKYEIGFFTDENYSFLKIIDIYYNEQLASTAYTKSEISKFLKGGQKKPRSVPWDQSFCCKSTDQHLRSDINMNDVYQFTSQDRSFSYQLQTHVIKTEDKRYLRNSDGYSFNRGHLTPKASMLYASASYATFAYLNTAPQWVKINNGNWAKIENHITDMATMLKKDLIVVTGVYKQLALHDVDISDLRPMYLYADRYGRESVIEAFPIPLYMFKLVIDPADNKGVVFVTVNNPFIVPGPEYHLCTDVMFRKDGAKMPKQWNPKNPKLGYSYMCSVPDFIQHTSYDFVELTSLPTNLLYLPSSNSQPVFSTPSTSTTTQHIHDELK